jgi:hypothetical protein
MSAKKSFDVQVKRPAAKRKPQRKETFEPTVRRRKSLRAKREEERGKKNTLVLTLFVLLVGVVVFGLWQPQVRLSAVTAEETPDPSGITRIAKEKLTGTHYIVPRDSFFFYPQEEIREAILDAYPSVSALTLRRTGFTELQISASSRSSAFLWCGTPEEASLATGECYDTDAEGFVFSLMQAKEEETGVMLRVYAALDAASSTDTYPLRAKVKGAEQLPDILRFARAVGSLGIPLRSVAIRGDEADLYSAGGTKITYVVGKEKEAGRIAESAFSALNFMDGSVEYVDLRFGGKAYVKRRE